MPQLFSYPLYYGGSGITELSEVLDAINTLAPSFQFAAASLPQVSNQNIVIFKGTNWNFNVSGIGSNASGFYFTMKSDKSVADSSAILQINQSGVLILSGVAISVASGQVIYLTDNGGTGNIKVEPEVTSQINSGSKYFWDLKGINESTVRAFGHIDIREDITDRYA